MNNAVKDIRVALKLTQKQMAAKLGCSAMTVRRSEYDQALPRTAAVMANLRKLAKQAGVEIDDGKAIRMSTHAAVIDPANA